MFAGVFDGHGGFQASKFARAELLRNITSHSGFRSDDDADVMCAIREGFISTHLAMWKQVGQLLRSSVAKRA